MKIKRVQDLLNFTYLLLTLLSLVFCFLPIWFKSLAQVTFELALATFIIGGVLSLTGYKIKFWWLWGITALIWGSMINNGLY